MEQRHALEGVMDTSMKNLKEIVDANTVIGDPVTTPTGTVIIPVSKVSDLLPAVPISTQRTAFPTNRYSAAEAARE